MESDDRELYSVGEVAERLGLHVRTVRNYVRDGRLKAVRIGKQYRISRADFEALTSTPGPDPDSAEPAAAGIPRVRHVEVSTIVQIESVGPESASRLSTLITASVQAVRDSPDSLRIQLVHDRERSRLKIVILGGAADTAAVLNLLDDVLGPGNDLLPTEGWETDRA